MESSHIHFNAVGRRMDVDLPPDWDVYPELPSNETFTIAVGGILNPAETQAATGRYSVRDAGRGRTALRRVRCANAMEPPLSRPRCRPVGP